MIDKLMGYCDTLINPDILIFNLIKNKVYYLQRL